MSRLISKAEGFEKVYEAYRNVNFSAFDYESLKQAMIEYLRLYFPESFSDYIESSEFVALLEIFAYMGEIISYRLDMVGSENAINFAQRKQSILRLATLISYKVSRNVPARGLVKLNSISTTERVFDSQGVDLSNRVIFWNDPNNANWKDQFFAVIGKILEQQFGTVSPNERVQVDNVLFELYPLKNNPLTRGVLAYNAAVAGQNYSMELVSSLLNENGPSEARPNNGTNFNVLYGSDGLGDNSNLTGFFMYTKQGTLSKQTVEFDGILPNQTFNVGVDGINNTDVWVNHIDSDSGITLDDGSSSERASGEWQEVDLANVENIIFNTNPTRTKYEVETLENDDVRLIFGDGEFSDIPSGTFDVWYRTSESTEIYVPESGIINKRASFTYQDLNNRVQTTTFTFSLVSALQNNAASEDNDHIRRTAPSVYYAQDRMVNNRDYNNFPLRDSSILKIRTINRTFAGDTKYQSANDPSFTYQDVKIFGDDLAVYYQNSQHMLSAPGISTSNVLLKNYVEPLLSTVDVYLKHVIDYTNSAFRREFTNNESSQIVNIFDSVSYPWPVSLIYFDQFTPSSSTPDGIDHGPDEWVAFPGAVNLGSFVADIVIALSTDETTFTITYSGKRMIGESSSTHFFYDNGNQRVLSFNTLNSDFDKLIILQANRSVVHSQLLQSNITLKLLEIERFPQGLSNAGLPNLNKVAVITQDINGDSIPDNVLLSELMDTSFTFDVDPSASINTPQSIQLPVPYITGHDDITIANNVVDYVEYGLIIQSISSNSGTGDNSFVFSGNQTVDVSVSDLITIVAPDSDHSGLYRVGLVNYDGTDTTVSIETVSSVADPFGEYPNMKFEIDGVDGGQGGIMTVHNRVTDIVYVYQPNSVTDTTFTVKEYVYFNRESINDEFVLTSPSVDVMTSWSRDYDQVFLKREHGKNKLNFMWSHTTSQLNLVDPATTNIHDMFIVTRSFYTQYSRWLFGEISNPPSIPTSQHLRNSYGELLDSKMLSDTVILHPGKLKLLIGSKANPELRAKIKIIRSENRTLTDNQVKIRVVNIVRDFFNVEQWEFGEQFFYTELDTKIQSEMPSEISSTVLVPTSSAHVFGDLYQVFATEDEILQVHIDVTDIEIVESFNATNLRQIT